MNLLKKDGKINMEFVLFLVAIGASTIGAISGMGGGVIIKPVMDAVSGLSASTISFMSCCTVLTMALSTYIRGIKTHYKLDYSILVPLALGGAIGGVTGKTIFSLVEELGNISLIQATSLLIVYISILIYVLNKSHITTKTVNGLVPSLTIGIILGCVSAFLGIGGGPINIAVLSYFYSTSPKVTAKNSLFIILFSQLTSFGTTLISGVPTFNTIALTLMCSGAVVGALIGGKCSKLLSEKSVDNLFITVLSVLIALGCYNVYTFSMI